MTIAPLVHPCSDLRPDCGSTLDEPLLFDRVENCDGRSTGDGVAGEGTADRAIGYPIHDLRAADHTRERQPSGDRLGNGHQVGLYAEMLHREQLSRPAETRLNFVGDHRDPVLVTDPSNSLHELDRRDDEATLTLNRLEDDRCDLLGGDLSRKRPLEVEEGALGVRAPIGICERDAVDLRRRSGPSPAL